MFDETFRHSDSYFTALQLLRIFEEEARGVQECLSSLGIWITHPPTHVTSLSATGQAELLEKNNSVWQAFMMEYDEAQKALLSQIERRSNEIRNLRDSVSTNPSNPKRRQRCPV